MGQFYKIDFQNLDYWKKESDEELNATYFARANEPGTLLLEKTDDFYFYGMRCNYKKGNANSGVRIREYGEYLIIEPSGIVVPKENMTMVSSDEASQVQDNIPVGFNTDTFFCNLISDFTRGGRRKITVTEIEALANKIINNTTHFGTNSDGMSPVDFMIMFCYYMN